MLSRRAFGGIAGSWLARGALARAMGGRSADAEPGSRSADRCSVMLWTLKGSFAEKLETAARAGFHMVELVEEFKPWSEADWQASLARMKALDLRVDAMAGVKTGFAQPGGTAAYVAELRALTPVARRLGCGQIILLSGPVRAGAAPGEQHEAAIETLRAAAGVLGEAGLIGVIEPIDRLEQPTIYLDGVTEAFALTRAVGSPAVKVLYDLYHEQRSQGNLLEKLEKNIDQVGLIHVADVPGRHAPGTGEIHYANVYKALGRLRYTGVVAMEFYPEGDAVAELRKARREAEAGLGGSLGVRGKDHRGIVEPPPSFP